MIFFFWEHLFWHCGMFMCFAPTFVIQCKNSFIIGFYVNKQAYVVKNNYVIHNNNKKSQPLNQVWWLGSLQGISTKVPLMNPMHIGNFCK
jgi:hypothetical protein